MAHGLSALCGCGSVKYTIYANTWIYRSTEVSPMQVSRSTLSWEQRLSSKLATYTDDDLNLHTTANDPYYIFRLPFSARPWMWVVVRKTQVQVSTTD